MSENCTFCKIVLGQIPSHKVYEDETVLAFKDISPKAPVHIVIIPKRHIASLCDISDKEEAILGHIQIVASRISKQFKEMKDGFRLVSNCGMDAGQTVFHIHYHLLGGRQLACPFG